MKYEYTEYNYSPTDEEIIEDLIRVVAENGLERLTINEYENYGKFNSSTVLRRFGTWNYALTKAGISISQQFWTEEQLFENIEFVWTKKGSQPRRRDMDNKDLSYISSGAYLRRFGKWSAALKEFIDYINKEDEIKQSETILDKNTIQCSHKTKRDINLRIRFKVLSRDSFKCCICGRSPATTPGLVLHVDHIIPWSKGGETVIDNLQTLCSDCNLGKSNIE